MQARLFEEHRVRRIVDLDGLWEFSFPSEGIHIAPEAFESGRRERMLVPGVWAMYHRYVNYQGEALARRKFSVERAAPARLVFKAVSHTATVFLDGARIGYHYNGFTPFAVDIPGLEAGEHELLLHISSEHHADSSLHVANDYYTYGGISRPCELQLLEAPCYIEFLHGVPVRDGEGKWVLEVAAHLRNLGAPFDGMLRVEAAGQRAEIPVSCSGASFVASARLPVGAVEEWTPSHPVLYPLRAELLAAEKSVDDKTERVGFREVQVAGEKILLNGHPVRLAGVNRHEDHVHFGCAIPLEAMEKDLDLLEALNANAVRTSHYPNDERFLDLCDERGFLVWEENHARGIGAMPQAPMDHPKFREQCAQVNREMVMNHRNHPCIFVWGILNECDSYTEYGRARYAEQFAQIRELDPSRPVTYAACYDFEAGKIDRCQDLPDIASWNRYPGWYKNPGAEVVFPKLFAEFGPKGLAGKPFICSEIGAGGLYGYHDPFRRGMWSEEAQAETLKAGIGYLCSEPRVSGIFIWQFADCRVHESWGMGRPRCYNNKGLLDEYRRPKMAFFTVGELFQEWLANDFARR